MCDLSKLDPTPLPLPANMCLWDNIPAEMRALNQWCVARYPDKVPHRIVNGFTRAVDVTNAELLHSFDEAVAFCRANVDKGWRMGFALLPTDQYVCVDIDYTKLDDDAKARLGSIIEGFSSFTEMSTSCRGCHIWLRGSDAAGVRRGGIEVYSHGRYMMMTGMPLNDDLNLPIVEKEVELAALRSSLASEYATNPVAVAVAETAQVEEDSALLNRIIPFMREGGKFSELWEGKWHGFGYPSQSEADDALMAILVRFTRNREQLKRLFLQSALGDRILHPEKYDKKKGKDYLDRTIDSAFKTLWEPDVDISGFLNRVQGVAEESPSVRINFDRLGFPPGHLGQIAEWIYANSRLPNRTIALATAFAFAAGVVGNAWSFGDGSQGCNLYVLLVGPSGIGKNGGSSAIVNIIQNCSSSDGKGVLSEFYNFTNYVSAPGLRKAFIEHKQFLNIRKEIGELMFALTTGRMNTRWADYGSLIKDLYHESGVRSVVGGLGYSDTDLNVDSMVGVCYSLFGETTPEGLFSNMTSNLSEDGLVSRMSVFITSDERPEMNKKRSEFPKHLVELLINMANIAIERNYSDTTYVVPITDEANNFYERKESEWRERINSFSASEHLLRSQYNRNNVKALKYATLIAVFNNPQAPVVTKCEMEYAIRLAEIGCDAIVSSNEAGLIGGDENSRVDALSGKLRDFFKDKNPSISDSWKKMRSDGCVPFRYLYLNLRKVRCYRDCSVGASRALDDALRVLCADGTIVELNPLDVLKTYGRKSRVFKVLG